MEGTSRLERDAERAARRRARSSRRSSPARGTSSAASPGSASATVSRARISFAAIHMKRGESRSASASRPARDELAPHAPSRPAPSRRTSPSRPGRARAPRRPQVDPLRRLDGVQVTGVRRGRRACGRPRGPGSRPDVEDAIGGTAATRPADAAARSVRLGVQRRVVVRRPAPSLTASWRAIGRGESRSRSRSSTVRSSASRARRRLLAVQEVEEVVLARLARSRARGAMEWRAWGSLSWSLDCMA